MEIGIVGLGRMGGGLCRHALEEGVRVVGFDRASVDRELLDAGLERAPSLAAFRDRLRPPRIVLLYVPAGAAVDEVLGGLGEDGLEPGDLLADGGNSYWGDSITRHARLAERGLRFVDLGTSGGPSGARSGACFMAGGEREAVAMLEPVLAKLAAPGGYVHAGGPGAGHFVKLVHNGIEFGMLQAIAEGVDLLEHWDASLPVADVLRCFRHGSAIRSWLMDLMEAGYRQEPGLTDVSSHVDDTGEVNWLVADAMRMERPVPVIAESIMQLFVSRDDDRTAARAIAVMRRGFGGHPYGANDAARQERWYGRVGAVRRAPGEPPGDEGKVPAPT